MALNNHRLQRHVIPLIGLLWTSVLAAPIENLNIIANNPVSAERSSASPGENHGWQALHIDERLNDHEKQLANLQGELDTIHHQLAEIITQNKQLEQQLKDNVAQLQKAADDQNKTHDQINQLYQEALSAMQRQAYDEAHQKLVAITKAYPKSDQAGAAYYWLGDLAWMKGQTWTARQDYREVVNRYPQHPKESSALYKLIQVDLKLNKPDQAQKWYKKLQSDYADADITRQAQKLLADAHISPS